MLDRAHRLTRSRDIQRVFQRGTRVSTRHMTLLSLPGSAAATRLAFVTSKKVGKAVVRNRIRRRVREAIRLLGGGLTSGRDVVITIRHLPESVDCEMLREEVRYLLKKSQLAQ